MNQIERTVRRLREKFIEGMLIKKGPTTQYEEINMMFESKNQPESRIHSSVKKNIEEIKNRNISAQLEERLKILALDEKKKDSKKKTDSGVKEIIKSKPKFNPLLKPREQLDLGYFMRNPVDLIETPSLR